MIEEREQEHWTGRLPTLPIGARVLLTVFLAIIGSGYLVAVANVYHTRHMADGKPGISFDDILATYSGLTVQRSEPVPSRMLTMISTTMRQYVTDADFAILEAWLEAGGRQADLDQGENRRKTPRRAIIRNCLRCHAQSTQSEISHRAPFGPDEFEVDYGKIAQHVAVIATGAAETVRTPPQYDVPRLILVSHMHMLTIPIFALVVGLLFLATRMPKGLRTVVAPIPMIMVATEFASWWLAREWDVFAILIAGTGLIFALAFGFQLLAVAVDLWRPNPATERLQTDSES